MRCFHPWKPPAALGLPPTTRLACQRCIGCRLRSSADWASRCEHEAKQHQHNCWITLTYNDEALPSRYFTGTTNPLTGKPIYSGSLLKAHMQTFYRRIRKKLTNHTEGQILHSDTPAVDYLPPNMTEDQKIRFLIDSLKATKKLRYYYAGEYGEKYRRPHYHACLFGVDFKDKKHVRTTDQGFPIYESHTLQNLWPHGTTILADLNWQTAAYTARYVMKKQNNNPKHYQVIDQQTGEIITLEPEFNDMSRRPGIGFNWFQKYNGDIYKGDNSVLITKTSKHKPPRYYDKLYARLNQEHLQQLKKGRIKQAIANLKNTSHKRLQAEEIITHRRIQSLRQKL